MIFKSHQKSLSLSKWYFVHLRLVKSHICSTKKELSTCSWSHWVFNGPLVDSLATWISCLISVRCVSMTFWQLFSSCNGSFKKSPVEKSDPNPKSKDSAIKKRHQVDLLCPLKYFWGSMLDIHYKVAFCAWFQPSKRGHTFDLGQSPVGYIQMPKIIIIGIHWVFIV